MERKIEFTPAFDQRNVDSSKNYGIHGVEMRWILKGDQGAVQFVVYTNWHLPHVQQELEAKASTSSMPYLMFVPQPANLGYHSPVPMYEGQIKIDDNCPHTGGACYYDGSGLQAEEVFRVLVEQGHEAVWNILENRYNEMFSR